MPDGTGYCIQNKDDRATKWVIRQYIINQLFAFFEFMVEE